MPTNRHPTNRQQPHRARQSFFFSDHRIQPRPDRDLQHPLSLSVRSPSRPELSLLRSFSMTKGLIVKIYQGPVEPDSVLEDSRNIPETHAETRMERGLPFPGVASTTEFTRNYLSYGSIFFERGYMTEAEHFLQLALRDDPDNSEALYGIGSIYLQQNKPTEARATFERVIKLPQRYPGTLPERMEQSRSCCQLAKAIPTKRSSNSSKRCSSIPIISSRSKIWATHIRQAKRWDDAKSTLQHALAAESRKRGSELRDGHGVRADQR